MKNKPLKGQPDVSLGLVMGALSAAGLSIANLIGSDKPSTPLDDTQRKDESRFLNTLTDEPKRIWKRRIAKGLSKSELTYIRSKLNKE